MLEAALRHQVNGDYERAIAGLRALLEASLTQAVERQARYHLAESLLSHGDFQAAAAAWEDYIAAASGPAEQPDQSLAPATFMLALARDAAGDCAQAIPHYEAYVELGALMPTGVPLADLAYERVGDCLAANDDPEAAMDAYRRAIEATANRSLEVSLRERIANAHLAMANPESAVTEYDAILDVARLDNYRAKIEYLAGQALEAAGLREDAYARYVRAVQRYPKAEYAYLSLVELVDAPSVSAEGAGNQGESTVDDFQRGMVDLYAGPIYPDAYGAAVRAFDRYLATGPANEAETLYHKALAQRGAGQYGAALATLESTVDSDPGGPWAIQAWFEQAVTLRQMGSNDRAVRAHEAFVERFPEHALAPRALMQAAGLREREGAHAEAAALYQTMQSRYPETGDADLALWRAALAHYRADELDSAEANWQALADNYPRSEHRAGSLYWLGKLANTTGSSGDDHWDQLLAVEPDHYYALRAEQIRSGDAVTSTRMLTDPVLAPERDAEEEKLAIADWLSTWTEVPTDTNPIDLLGSPLPHAGLERGLALSKVGLRREALGVLAAARAEVWSDPWQLAQLALFLRDQGFHGLAARSGLRLAGLWPGGTAFDAPLAVQRLAHPLVYVDLLSLEAAERDLDPTLLAAVIWQESLFEPSATSSAGARGLGQVMPATGQDLAGRLGVMDFELDDLYKPYISVEFAASYLAAMLNYFDDQLLVALVAYNGGPGNAGRWLEAAGGDLDLFIDAFAANESRRYLQRVLERYLLYDALYRPDQAEIR